MHVIDKNKLFPVLIAAGLAIPAGLANYFIPSYRASSVYDVELVYIPIVAIQVFISVIYIIFFGSKIPYSSESKFKLKILFFAAIAPAMLSLSITGYYSYSLLWLICPMLVAQYFKNGDYSPWEGSKIFGRIAMIFLPLYCVDFVASILFNGENAIGRFSSYMFATNGHTFVSFLFVLFLTFYKIEKDSSYWLRGYVFCSALVYFSGGIYSASRVPLAALIFSIFFISGKKYIYSTLLCLTIFYLFFSLDNIAFWLDKIDIESNLISNISDMIYLNTEDTTAWSSAYSRAAIWDTFLNTFFDNWFAGAGGLGVNLVKYDYGYPFDVFIDPHNEYLYVFSGFGLSGLIFIACAFSYIISHFKNVKFIYDSIAAKRRYMGILIYLFICSMANANSAKQNIQFLLVITLVIIVGQLSAMGLMRRK